LDGSEVTLFKSPDRCSTAVRKLVEYYDHIKMYQGVRTSDVGELDITNLDEAKRMLSSKCGQLRGAIPGI